MQDAIRDALIAKTTAEALRIRSANDHQRALNLIAEHKAILKTGIEQYKEAVKDPINEVRAFVLDVEHRIVDPRQEAIEILDAKAIAYEDEAKRIAAEQQAEIDRKAREQAERDRQAELKRLDQQAKRTTDPIEKQELRREIEITKSEPVHVETRTVEARVGSRAAAGLRRNETWDAEVFDEAALWKAVIAGKVSRAAFTVDQKFLDSQAKSMKAAMNTPINEAGDLPWPGVRAVCDRSNAATGRGRK